MVVAEKEGGGELKPGISDGARKGAEKKTEIVFFLGTHTPEYAHRLRSMTERRMPDCIVLEEPKDEEFQRMLNSLKGKNEKERSEIIDDYVRKRGYLHQDCEREILKVVADLNEKGVKIKQMDVVHDLSFATRGAMVLPPFLAMETRVIKKMGDGDFDKAVNSVLNAAGVMVVGLDERNRIRANLLVTGIEKGELGGYVIVEAGKQHVLLKRRVMEKLRGEGAVIKTEYEHGETAREVFGRWAQEVRSPFEELVNLYENGVYGPINEKWKKKWGDRWRRDGYDSDTIDERGRVGRLKDAVKGWVEGNYGDERERLLGARTVLMFRVVEDPFDVNEKWMGAVRMVNRLNYTECKKVFEEMNAKEMDEEAAFKFLESYVKNRK